MWMAKVGYSQGNLQIRHLHAVLEKQTMDRCCVTVSDLLLVEFALVELASMREFRNEQIWLVPCWKPSVCLSI